RTPPPHRARATPRDNLKIDGSFIKELTRSRVDRSLVQMIGEVAKAAGLETVAEYVENAAVLKLLTKYGIDYAQGFHIGRAVPQPAEAVLEIQAYHDTMKKRVRTDADATECREISRDQ